MNTYKYFFLLIAFSLFIVDVGAEAVAKEEPNLIGTIWQLDRNSSSSKFSSHGQVLYFFSSDAYQTYNARKFSHWDSFSAVDSRDLVRLKKRQKIKVLNSKFNDAIYEVTLLDGFYAGKTYFLIADELKNFTKEQINEEAV
jgi:YHS domain-containing protein